jgi:hypothetical protein
MDCNPSPRLVEARSDGLNREQLMQLAQRGIIRAMSAQPCTSFW